MAWKPPPTNIITAANMISPCAQAPGSSGAPVCWRDPVDSVIAVSSMR